MPYPGLCLVEIEDEEPDSEAVEAEEEEEGVAVVAVAAVAVEEEGEVPCSAASQGRRGSVRRKGPRRMAWPRARSDEGTSRSRVSSCSTTSRYNC
jgi:hypothetical protein